MREPLRLAVTSYELLVKALPAPLNGGAPATALGGADLLVTCVDQDGPRLRVAHWSRDWLIPHLDIGAGVTRTAAAYGIVPSTASLTTVSSWATAFTTT